MHIVNPSGVNFTNKYLTCFRCLGLEDHGLGGAANGGKKAARAAKRALFALLASPFSVLQRRPVFNRGRAPAYAIKTIFPSVFVWNTQS